VRFAQVTVTSRGALRKIAESQDELIKGSDKLVTLARTLLSPHWRTYVRQDAFRQLQIGNGEKLQAHSVLLASIFGRSNHVLIAGANFTDSLLYKHFTKEGVHFEPDERLAEMLRYRQHENGT
jgi:hypothetical protein